ncbi:MAG: ABC transporter ATP-binding protein [Dehalococcoidia bacterium]
MGMFGSGMGGMGAGRGGMGRGSFLGRSDAGIGDEDFGRPFDWTLTRRLWVYVRPFRIRFSVSIFLMLVYTVTNVLNPYFITFTIDRVIVPRHLGQLTPIVLVYILLNVIMWWSSYGQTYLMTYVGQWTLYQVARDMFSHLQALSLSFYDQNETGRIMSRVQNDVTVLQQLLSSGIISILASSLTLIGIIFILLALNWKLALLVFITMPVMAAFLYIWQKYAIGSFRKTRSAISAVNASLQENVSGVRVIQSLTREGVNMGRFGRLNAQNLDVNLEASRVTAIIQPVIEVVAAIATAVVVIVGGKFVFDRSLSIGALVGFTLYIQRFFDPIRQITQQYTQLQRSTVAMERIFEVLDQQPDVQDAVDAVVLPPIEGRVVFDNVSFAYIPGIPVLKHFSLDVQAGETIALVGHTGAGKSTIISLLARFYDVTDGALSIDGHDVRSVAMGSLRSQLGMVLQEPFLFSGTVRENIRYGRIDATDAEIEEAAAAVGAHELIMRLEYGYATLIRERGINLSVGERQLISFARALLARPRILILDEATANIDTFTEQIVQEGVQRMVHRRTSFVIAHRLATIKHASRIVVMREGEIVEIGSHEELIARRGLYYTLYSMGFREVGAAVPSAAIP